MSPIVLPRNERAAAKRGVSGAWSSGLPAPGPSQAARVCREWQGSGDTRPARPRAQAAAHAPHPAPPAAPARLQKRRRAGRQPEEGGRVPGGPGPRGRGGTCRCKGACPGRAPPPSASGPARAPPPPRTLPRQPRARRRGAAGPAGLGGPHVRALPGGGVPGEHAARAGSGESPRTPSLLLLSAAAAASSFLLRARPPVSPGGGSVRRARSGQALQEAGAPQASGGGGRRRWRRRGPGNFAPLCAPGPGGGGQVGAVGAFPAPGWGRGRPGGPQGRGRSGGGAPLLCCGRRGGGCGSQCSRAGRGRRAGRGLRSRRSRAGRGPRTKEPERLRARPGLKPSAPPPRALVGAGRPPGSGPLAGRPARGATPDKPHPGRLSGPGAWAALPPSEAFGKLYCCAPWGRPSDLQ